MSRRICPNYKVDLDDFTHGEVISVGWGTLRTWWKVEVFEFGQRRGLRFVPLRWCLKKKPKKQRLSRHERLLRGHAAKKWSMPLPDKW